MRKYEIRVVFESERAALDFGSAATYAFGYSKGGNIVNIKEIRETHVKGYYACTLEARTAAARDALPIFHKAYCAGRWCPII